MKGYLVRSAKAGGWTPATGVVAVGTGGKPATKRAAGVTGSIEPQDRRVKPSHRARSGEVSRGTASDNPSRSRCTGALTALAFVLIIGNAERFDCGKQVTSYLGLVPLEKSRGNRRRLGHITKQGSSIMRFLLVEAAQATVRSLPEWRSSIITYWCDEDERSPKLPWLVSWPSACTGCGARDGITSNGRSSVRTWESPDIAMVCSRTPRY